MGQPVKSIGEWGLKVQPGTILVNSWKADPHTNSENGAPLFLFREVGLYEAPTREHGKRYYVAALKNGRSQHWLSDEAEHLRCK